VYKKTVKKVTKFKAHDQDNSCKVGDTVSIIETRPLSKEKKWTVLEIVERA
jgi:small subunit ribosomal protein S17